MSEGNCSNCRGNELLTVTGAARFLGVDRHTVWAMCKRFELRYIPRGRKGRWIPRKELDAWISRNLVGSPEDLKRAVDGRRRRRV